MKVVVGLGNPGPRYDETRHNVGWWALDRMAYDWDFGHFEATGKTLMVRGVVEEESVLLVKPQTYVNRSGQALTFLAGIPEFSLEEDLLIVVDDATLDVGRLRMRMEGSSGGHNGLLSIEQALGHDQYTRLRIGVGRRPDDVDMSDWVLSAMPAEDEGIVVDLLPEVTRAVETWIGDGADLAMSRFNR